MTKEQAICTIDASGGLFNAFFQDNLRPEDVDDSDKQFKTILSNLYGYYKLAEKDLHDYYYLVEGMGT